MRFPTCAYAYMLIVSSYETTVEILWYPDEPIGKGGAILGSCTLPSRSMARAVMITFALVVGFQAYSQITQVRSDAGCLRIDCCHVSPASRLTSARLIPLLTEKVTPAM